MTTDLAAILEERTAKLRAPIAPDRPSGEDVSFGSDFERIERELAKLTGVDGARPEWEVINDLSSQMLSMQTKDFRLAVWSTVAKTNLARWEGLAEGLVVCRQLVRDYWTTMYPDAKRLRGRANLVGWMCEQIVAALEGLEVSRADEATLLLCDKLLGEIDRDLSDRLGEAHPGRGRTSSLLESKIAAIPAPETSKPSQQMEVAEAAPASVARVIMGLVAPEGPGEAGPAVASAAEIMLTAAALLFEADPSDPAPYRIRRACVYLRAGDGERAPSDEERAQLPALDQAHDWLSLVRASEEALLACPAWLDAHRYVAHALAQLGASFGGARTVVETTVRAKLARDPGLATDNFEDGKPRADAATRAWLEQEIRRGASPTGLLIAEDAQNGGGLQTARQLIRDGRVADAISLALGMARRGGDGRSRFLGNLAAARLAIEAERVSLARPILESLVDEITARNLEDWDPDLCVGVYHTLIPTLEDSDPKRNEYFDRLCRLDPSVAFLGRK